MYFLYQTVVRYSFLYDCLSYTKKLLIWDNKNVWLSQSNYATVLLNYKTRLSIAQQNIFGPETKFC